MPITRLRQQSVARGRRITRNARQRTGQGLPHGAIGPPRTACGKFAGDTPPSLLPGRIAAWSPTWRKGDTPATSAGGIPCGRATSLYTMRQRVPRSLRGKKALRKTVRHAILFAGLPSDLPNAGADTDIPDGTIMSNRPQPGPALRPTPSGLRRLLLCGLLVGLTGCREDPQYKDHPLAYWTDQLQSKDPRRQLEAVAAMSEMGRAGVPALIQLLGHTDVKIRKKVVETLVEMQVGATEELGEWAEREPAGRQLLKELCLEKQDEGFFIALARAGPDAIPIFEELLRNQDRSICWSAAAALEEMQPPEAAMPLLKSALQHPHREVRERAAESLRTCIQME